MQLLLIDWFIHSLLGWLIDWLILSGDDAYGRKVIVLSACRLPAREDIDHEKFLLLVSLLIIDTSTAAVMW